MPADFSSYQQVEQPSMTGEMFGSPAKAWWTLQKGSFFMNSLNGKMWSGAAKGAGIQWGGVVGFRGIALGQGAAGSAAARAFSPSHLVTGAIEAFSPGKAATFREFGLFGAGTRGLGGTGGLWNATGIEGVAGVLGKVFGGGIIEGSKFDSDMLKKFKWETKRHKQLLKVWKSNQKISNKNLSRFGVSAQKRALNPSWLSGQRAVSARRLAKTSGSIAEDIVYLQTRYNLNNIKPKAPVASAAYTQAKFVQRLATVGKFASWTMAASIAFDVGSALGGFAVNTLGNAADKLERSMANTFNRQMEFGGKVGIGFYSGTSGTERQRALSTIRGGASPGFGNEASYQHLDSSW